jgi:hypothetical protein
MICPTYKEFEHEWKEFGNKSYQIRQDYMKKTNYDWKSLDWDKFKEDTMPLVEAEYAKMSPRALEWGKTHGISTFCEQCPT